MGIKGVNDKNMNQVLSKRKLETAILKSENEVLIIATKYHCIFFIAETRSIKTTTTQRACCATNSNKQ